VFGGGVITIKDMGTSNGTKINEQPIPANLPVEYHIGQILTLGLCPVSITFEFPSEEKAEG
jgi:hypothetical protein